MAFSFRPNISVLCVCTVLLGLPNFSAGQPGEGRRGATSLHDCSKATGGRAERGAPCQQQVWTQRASSVWRYSLAPPRHSCTVPAGRQPGRTPCASSDAWAWRVQVTHTRSLPPPGARACHAHIVQEGGGGAHAAQARVARVARPVGSHLPEDARALRCKVGQGEEPARAERRERLKKQRRRSACWAQQPLRGVVGSQQHPPAPSNTPSRAEAAQAPRRPSPRSDQQPTVICAALTSV